MDPVPFLFAAYGLGACGLLFFWCVMILQRRKLLKVLFLLKHEKKASGDCL